MDSSWKIFNFVLNAIIHISYIEMNHHEMQMAAY